VLFHLLPYANEGEETEGKISAWARIQQGEARIIICPTSLSYKLACTPKRAFILFSVSTNEADHPKELIEILYLHLLVYQCHNLQAYFI
jgi:hypothetical protein